MNLHRATRTLVLLSVGTVAFGAHASAATGRPAGNVAVSAVFADHVVLQRGVTTPVWGTATPNGGDVVVTIADRTARAVVEASGDWRADLHDLPTGGPYVMTVSGQNTITINDVLVGDVWLASGQSNMAYAMVDDPANRAVAATSDDSQLRFMRVQPIGDSVMRRAFTGPVLWTSATKADFGYWPGIASAVAFYFARDLRRREHVPIGILEAVDGGTAGEAWLAAPAIDGDPTLRQAAAEKLVAAGAHKLPIVNYTPGALFNVMVAPMVGYSVSGVLWYQGEQNTWPLGSAPHYELLLRTLIADWRTRWGSNLPFYVVQLAGYDAPSKPADPNDPAESAIIREAQMDVARSVPAVYLAVASDLGQADGYIHPPDKNDVGLRLALIARKARYGESVAVSGPTFSRIEVMGANVLVRFDHVDGGLIARGGPPHLFAIAGADGKFVWANARIVGSSVLVFSAAVPRPLYVRYAWSKNPLLGNLYNGIGLPAPPFRSDRSH